MDASHSPVLVSWVAINNDPYERDRDEYRLDNGNRIPGPTLTLLFDGESPFAGTIEDVVFLYSTHSGNAREKRAVDETIETIQAKDNKVRIHRETWDGDDPTDLHGIFAYLREAMPKIQHRFAGRELLIHISPGTPSMQTIWLLMAESGFFQKPFRVVKSYRKHERRGRKAVVPVELGLETFYKAYSAARPGQVASVEEEVLWNPARFRTERMRSLFIEARRFARLKIPVLLLGERGTGKTTLASWIRVSSMFRRPEMDKHWPAVACGQYSPETMRSELFGHEKGAFTGATKNKKGLLAAAHEDTLFLDEVGDVSRDLQRLLIKVLEEKQYVPLGHDKPESSDFRLLTATNLEPDELTSRLDADFLDRISPVVLRLPAVREVRDELPWLWEDVCKRAASRAGVTGFELDALPHERVLSRLEEHPLPGNLRDLFRVAYRTLAAVSDPHAPLTADEAVDYGLQALEQDLSPGTNAVDLPRAVAQAFARNGPLDKVLDAAGWIETKKVEQALKGYLADELRRLASTRSVKVEELCDMSDRTLRDWSGGADGGKKSSGKRKKSSGKGVAATDTRAAKASKR